MNSVVVGATSTKLAVQHERRAVRDPGRLLHVVRDDDDRHVPAQLVDQLFDLLRADGVQRSGRLVEQEHLGLDRQRAGDAEPLLLAAGQPDRAVAQPVLDLVPQRGAPERAFSTISSTRAWVGMSAKVESPAATLSRIDIVGKGVGRWKTIPMCCRTAVTLTSRP